MKNTFRNFALAFAINCFIGSQVFALTNPTFNYYENQTLIIEFNDWNSKSLTLEILDEEGSKVYIDNLSEGLQNDREYQLKDLKIGKYYIVLYGEKDRTISSFTKGIDGLRPTSESISKLFQPEIEIRKKKLSISYSAYGEDVRLSILGKRGLQLTLLYEGKLKIAEEVDLSALAEGSYVAVLKSGSQTVSIPFKK